MPAPTAEFTDGAGSITATGEANGLLGGILPRIARPRLLLGVSGTFTTVVLAVRGRLRGLTNYYPLLGKRRGTGVPVANSAAIPLSDSTAEALEFDVSGCDYYEVYAVSGTPTDLDVEARVEAGDPDAAPVVLVNQSSNNTITSASAAALAVGANGATNPVLAVDANTASVATGWKATGAAAAAGAALAVISSGTNEAGKIDSKGSGTLTLQSVGTGNVVIGATKLTVAPATGNLSGAGSILSTSASGGVGYATGAGATVTQASSRTTGVTINTPTGNIVLVSAAGSATPFSFTVTNSSVAAGDTVVVSQKSGTDKYTTIAVTAVAAGSFQLTLANASGTTTEQPVFNFTVIKGVAA